MHVAVLVLDGAFDTGLSAVLDTFAIANELGGKESFSVSRIALRRRVRTAQGFIVPVHSPPAEVPDVVFVPALGAKAPSTLDRVLSGNEARDAAALVGTWRASGARVAAACTATFLVGASGVLDGLAATTTWWLASHFRQRFPRVKLAEHRMLVETRGVSTAGAALGHLDLALAVVRRQSPSLARLAARYLTFDRRPSQGAYSMPDHVEHEDALVERFETWARRHLGAFNVRVAARELGTSERTLERRVQHTLGRSPLAYVRDLRVEDAMHQLETTDRGLDEIATRVGYEDAATLRALLRKKTGVGVRELRRRNSTS